MQPKYEVPIIPHNLRREETIIQIAEALQYLSEVSTDIFQRIDARIAQNKTQVSNISDRIAVASTKLNKLAGAKKATQVFSSSKYPGENTNKQYVSVFGNTNNNQVLPVKKFDYEYKSSQTGDENLEALQFYYVKVRPKSDKLKAQGLNEPPSDIETINDMLLFNTGRNAYSKDGIHDRSNNSLLNANKKGKDDSEVDIGAAPYSMSQGQNMGLPKTIGEKYFYSPHLGNVPTIDVPLDLPDLPGIADDLRYTVEHEANIGPSVSGINVNVINNTQLESVIPDLPEIEDFVDEKPNKLNTENDSSRTVAPPLAAVTTNTNVPPAPPGGSLNKEIDNPPWDSHANTANVNTESQPKTVENVVESKVKQSEVKKVTEKAKKPASGSDNARASLMDAIRNAGGAKSLKSQAESTHKQNNKEPAPTGDLMADLHAKLSMRRKGISGNKPDNPSAMDKISEMIPPPPSAQSDKSESAEEEDWDE